MTSEQPVKSHVELLDRMLNMPEFQFDADDIEGINELKKNQTIFKEIKKLYLQHKQIEADQKKQMEASIIDTEDGQKKAALIEQENKLIEFLKNKIVQAANNKPDDEQIVNCRKLSVKSSVESYMHKNQLKTLECETLHLDQSFYEQHEMDKDKLHLNPQTKDADISTDSRSKKCASDELKVKMKHDSEDSHLQAALYKLDEGSSLTTTCVNPSYEVEQQSQFYKTEVKVLPIKIKKQFNSCRAEYKIVQDRVSTYDKNSLDKKEQNDTVIVDTSGLEYKSLDSKPKKEKESISLFGQQHTKKKLQKNINKMKRTMKSSKNKSSCKRKKKNIDLNVFCSKTG